MRILMINLLILHELNKSPLTMYGISRQIRMHFPVFLKPSMGTLQPALKKLEKEGYLSSQKFMSKGGRPSICYALTNEGKSALRYELLKPLTDNPIQFMVSARIKLCCASVLENNDYLKLIKLLKRKTESLMLDTKKLVENENTPNSSRMILDNAACEYRNFLSLLEGLEHAGNC